MSGKIKKIIICIFLVVLLFLVFLLQCPFAFVSSKTTGDYSDIMHSVYLENNEFGNLPVTKIAMLGSHDAFSYGINYLSKSNTNEDNIVNNPFVYVLAHGLDVRLAKAQMANAKTQLKLGVRYFDVRVTYLDDTYYTSHGLVSIKLEDCLFEILEFLSSNSGEFIIFNINELYSDKKQDDLCDFIGSVKFEDKSLFDYVNYQTPISNLSDLTYNKVTDYGNKAGVVFCWPKYWGKNYTKYFESVNLSSEWHNDASTTDILPKIRQTASDSKEISDNYFKVNQSQTTPNFDQAFDVLFGWSLLDVANKHNANIIENEDFYGWLDGLPIYMCDFVTTSYHNFNKTANEKIKQHNLSLASNLT